MDNLHTINGKPVYASAAAATTLPAASTSDASKTHKPECGNVGATGQHGEIGSNAQVK